MSAEILTMTAERARKVEQIEPPDRSQKVAREAWRIICIPEAMHRAGSLNDDQWMAWQRFEETAAKATKIRAVVAAYGDRIDTHMAYVGESDYCPETARIYADKATVHALAAIGYPPAANALMYLVCNECGSLADLGKLFRPTSNRDMRSEHARTLIQQALWRLAEWYCLRSRTGA